MRDGTGHVRPQYAVDLEAHGQASPEPPDPVGFLDADIRADALAEQRARRLEDAVARSLNDLDLDRMATQGQPAECTGRRWRLLLAHDASASACDLLIDTIESALRNVEVCESSSVDDARVAIHGARFDVALVCLNLPPAPRAGVRLAQECLDKGLPVVLITRSRRWIPDSDAALHELPWVPPDAAVVEVSRAVAAALRQPAGGLAQAADGA